MLVRKISVVPFHQTGIKHEIVTDCAFLPTHARDGGEEGSWGVRSVKLLVPTAEIRRLGSRGVCEIVAIGD